MVTLRKFHLLFILIIFIAADLFGAWGVWTYNQTHQVVSLAAGALSFLLGFALAGYALWLVCKLDRAKIE